MTVVDSSAVIVILCQEADETMTVLGLSSKREITRTSIRVGIGWLTSAGPT
jgi:hypothetical protein